MTEEKRMEYTGKPYVRVPEACRISGLSMYCIRKCCENGTMKHFKSGRVYYIHVPSLLDIVYGRKD